MGVPHCLLLCALSVVGTAQDCGRPELPEGMVLRGDAVLQETFQSGSSVSLGCVPGYQSSGPPSLTCTGGTWNTLRMTCTKRNCGSAGEVVNGDVEYPEGTLFGAVLQVRCNPGYRRVGGTRVIRCGVQGWNGRLPVCEVVVCEVPPAVEHAIVSPLKDFYLYRDNIKYTCLRGYTLIGQASLTCSEDGTFTPDPPECSLCGKPELPEGMVLKGDAILQDGSSVSLGCDPGYQSAGPSSLTCTGGTWSTLRMTCTKRNCGSAGEVVNGDVEYPEGTLFGAVLQVRCNPGYRQIGGSKVIRCDVRGWEGRLPVCEAVVCEVPPAVEHAIVSPLKDFYLYRDNIKYTCLRGYTLIGQASLTCSEDGTFTPDPPECSLCGKPELPEGMVLKGDAILQEIFKEGSSVSLGCVPGYQSAGPSSLTCTGGTWSTLRMTCTKRNCGSAGEVVNGDVEYPEGTLFGAVLQVCCNPGYRRVGGTRVIRCDVQGWDGRLPVCEAFPG